MKTVLLKCEHDQSSVITPFTIKITYALLLIFLPRYILGTLNIPSIMLVVELY